MLNQTGIPFRVAVTNIGRTALPQGITNVEDAVGYLGAQARAGQLHRTYAVLQGSDGAVMLGEPKFGRAWPGLDQDGMVTPVVATSRVEGTTTGSHLATSTSRAVREYQIAPTIGRLDLTGPQYYPSRSEPIDTVKDSKGTYGPDKIFHDSALPQHTPNLSVSWQSHDQTLKAIVGPDGWLPLS